MFCNRRTFLTTSSSLAAGLVFATQLGMAQEGVRPLALRAIQSRSTLNGAVLPFDLWSYPGFVQGAPLVGEVGEVLAVELENALPVPTTLHWHGLRVPQIMDGVVPFGAALVMPGQSYTYDVPLKDPGFYWFHSHHDSLNQIARGLYGAIIVRDPAALPVFEQVLVLDDWTVQTDALGQKQMDWRSLEPSLAWGHGGVLGNLTTVNGTPAPQIQVNANGPSRLRLLNVATGRIFRPFVEGARSWLIASDGFDHEPRELTEGVFLAPGQRADILVEPNEGLPISLDVGDGFFGHGVRLALAPVRREAGSTSAYLAAHKPYEPAELIPGRVHKSYRLEMGTIHFDDPRGAGISDGGWKTWDELTAQHQYWLFNDVADGSQSLFQGRIGDTVEIELINNYVVEHVIHFHGQHVKVIASDKCPLEVGTYRDSICLKGDARATIQMRLAEPGRWPIHCHILGHQVSGMWTWYETQE